MGIRQRTEKFKIIFTKKKEGSKESHWDKIHQLLNEKLLIYSLYRYRMNLRIRSIPKAKTKSIRIRFSVKKNKKHYLA